MRMLLVLLLSIGLQACDSVRSFDAPIKGSFRELSPIEKAWIFGNHLLPPTHTKSGKTEDLWLWDTPSAWATVVSEKLISPKDDLPVIVFLHGCSGITAENKRYFDFMLAEGWAVFAPNSFARPGRTKTCSHRKSNTMSDRVDEARYALARLLETSWVDKKRIVLVGHSEGGEAVGIWSYEGYAAIISTGADCQDSYGRFNAPSSTPVLSLVGEQDTRQHPPCSIIGHNLPSKSVLIPEADHQVYLYSDAKLEIRRFLSECCGFK